MKRLEGIEMQDKTYTIKGTYKERSEDKKFTKEIKAVNEGYAREKLLSQIGSKHRVNRHGVKIASVQEKKE